MNWTKEITAAGLLIFASGAVQAADTVTFGAVGASSVTNWPSYVAASKGYFEAAAIKPDFTFPPSSSGLVQQSDRRLGRYGAVRWSGRSNARDRQGSAYRHRQCGYAGASLRAACESRDQVHG